ncbi:hypothetical protein BGZ83_006712, partial [Gryganskiella cystojenkinii]
MSASAGLRDPLDAIIDGLADPRNYHEDLVDQVTHLLNPQTWTANSRTARGKQVKRLVNMCMSTLTQWSKVHANAASLLSSSTKTMQPEKTLSSIPSTIAKTTTSLTITRPSRTTSTVSTATGAAVIKSAIHPTNMHSKTVSGRRTRGSVAAPGRASTQNRIGSQSAIAPQPPLAPSSSVQKTRSVSKSELPTASDPTNSIESPSYDQIPKLVKISFLGVSALETMGASVSTSLFDIEKARSNLITKTIEIGMKKRAFEELRLLRERLIQGAKTLWGDIDLVPETISKGRKQGSFEASSTDDPTNLKATYQHLFRFPFPKAFALQDQTQKSLTDHTTDPIQTFVLLVLALHNNAVRCWIDARSGSLAHFLHEMMQQRDSPLEWCMYLAKIHPQAAQRPLDALFRLLFIAAGKTLEADRTSQGHRKAFQLRMLAMRYFAAFSNTSGKINGVVWERLLRCGAEFDKEIRGDKNVEDGAIIIQEYKSIFEFVQSQWTVDVESPCFQSWCDHFAFLARKINDVAASTFVQNIRSTDGQPGFKESTPVIRVDNSRTLTSIAQVENGLAGEFKSPTGHTMVKGAHTPEKVIAHLEDSVRTLRKFEEFLHEWITSSKPDSDLERCVESTKSVLTSLENSLADFPEDGLTLATLQNIARIFRSMDTLRTIGSKTIDTFEKRTPSKLKAAVPERAMSVDNSGDITKQVQLLQSIEPVLELLSDITVGMWRKGQSSYMSWYTSDPKSSPSPVKLSCARVDAILLLFRLLSHRELGSKFRAPKSLSTLLDSALLMAREMGDLESLPWISNAMYNYGGSLFKAGNQVAAIGPLESAISAYRHWICKDEANDNALLKDDEPQTNTQVEARTTLANRYEVLGVCFLALDKLDRAVHCFDSGLCSLPLKEFQHLEGLTMREIKDPTAPVAKLLNRRVRALLMMPEARFKSIATSVPSFSEKMAQLCVPVHIPGVVQEYECGLLSILSIKTNQIGQRNQDQIDILNHLRNRIFKGGHALVHPVRRARVLVQLAVLSQSSPDKMLQQEALSLVDEAIDILKGRDLKADSELQHVRNHSLAMAYTWYGILERTRDDGLCRQSKPFQIALQLWEMILSEIECFYSVKGSILPGHRARVEKVLPHLPDPEQLYDHLQMLADCLGVIDYRIMQVQIYWLMLRLCNGVLQVTESTCLDAVRIYSRMSQVYLTMGYTGKAKAALSHGKRILEEMRGESEPSSVLESEVGFTWSLARSLYLMAIGRRTEGVQVFNHARKEMVESERQSSMGYGNDASNVSHRNANRRIMSRKAEALVRKTLALGEASLARSKLLHGEGNISEAILDAMRAVRQLSSVVSTVSNAVQAAQRDKNIIIRQPMENPFLDKQEPIDRNEKQPLGGETLSETQRLRKGLENLASLKYQWSVFKLLIDTFHQLAMLYLIQGCAREAQYFMEEGKHIAQLSKASKSMDRFTLDHAEFCLREHEWNRSEQLLQELVMKEQEITSDSSETLAWEILDAEIRMVHGDLRMAMRVNDLAVKDYFETDRVLAHLMDKKFISALEELVIREPQTPREKTMIQHYYQRQGPIAASVSRLRADGNLQLMTPATPDQAGLECLALSEMKASLGYRMGLLMGEMDEPGAMEMVEKARNQDPVALTSAEYHSVMARLLMMYLKDLMAVHVVYHMLSESVLSVGLFERTTVPQSSIDQGRAFFPPPVEDSSPSVRMTKMARRRSARQGMMQSPVTKKSREWKGVETTQSPDTLLQVVYEAKGHLQKAYQLSLQRNPPHVVADLCVRQAQLAVLESSILMETDSLGGPLASSSQAAFNLEKAKAITQRREMHSLVKQKLNPALPREDQSWPREIGSTGRFQDYPPASGRRDKFGGQMLTKPRPLNLMLLDANGGEEGSDMDTCEPVNSNRDLLDVGMTAGDLETRRGKREYLLRQGALHPSSSKGNERSFLQVLDDAYERDDLLEEKIGGFQEELVNIIPSNWTVVSMSMDIANDYLFVTRLRAKAMPIVVRLPLNRIKLRESDESSLGLSQRGVSEEVQYLSFKDAVEELQDILKVSQETLSVSSSLSSERPSKQQHEHQEAPVLTKQEKADWWSQRQHLDGRLRQLLDTIEDQWLCGLRGLIQSHNTPAQEKNLWEFKSSLEAIMFEAVNSQSRSDFHLDINVDLCRVFLHLGDKPSLVEIRDLIYFLMDAYLFKGAGSSSNPSSKTQSSIEYTEGKFAWMTTRIQEAMEWYWKAETAADNSGFDEGAHVILILDKHLQVFPWESCPVLREEAVSRMPSIWMLRDRILQQRYIADSTLPSPSNTANSLWQGHITTDPHMTSPATAAVGHGPWRDVEVNPSRAYYVLNPGGDLKNTEDEFKEYVQSQIGWEGVIGRAPMALECVKGLSQNELYIYFGHSGGEQYIKSQQIRSIGQSGCPTLVSNLWDVTDRDLDRFSKSMFTLWGLDSNREGYGVDEIEQVRSYKTSLEAKADSFAMDIDQEEPGTPSRRHSRLSLVEAVKGARDTCRLKYLVGAASVV